MSQHAGTGVIEHGTCREVAEKNAAEFTADKTRNLIVRLQFNVIRAGLRRVNLAYSRISLADVAAKLGMMLSHMSIPPCQNWQRWLFASLQPCLPGAA